MIESPLKKSARISYAIMAVLLVIIGWFHVGTLVLVSMKKLGSKDLTKVRKAALRLDRRAYLNAPDIYGGSPRPTRDD